MKTKMKKYGVIAGLGALCLVMVLLIGARFQTDKPVDEPVTKQDEVSLKNPVIDPKIGEPVSHKDAAPGDKPAVVINPVRDREENQGQAISTGTEQTIQPDVKKPEPTEEQLTNPAQTPDGLKVDTPAPEELTNPDKKPPNAPKQPDPPKQPQGGDTQNGKIFIPGFGWVDDHGGGGQGTTDNEMYENGNKIGIMG